MATFQNSKDFEVTLERVIVYLKLFDCKYTWFNQFNVASGFCGEHSDKKTSIDIVRQGRKEPSNIDLFELKEWDSTTALLK